MAFDGNGTFSRPVSPYVFDTAISETDVNAEMDGIATGLSTCITKDGQTTATARIDFAHGIATDTISEETGAAGVTVDGVLLKDNTVTANSADIDLVNTGQGSDIASASTVNLETATGNVVDVTGTTTITAITLSQGHARTVRFTGALTLTHGASLVLPGGANITTAAGDCAVFVGYAAGVVRCVDYQAASGKAVVESVTLGVNTFTGTQKWAKGADVASATALALGTDGNYFDVTGTTTIATIDTVGVGTWIKLHFDGALTLTHSADLVLPGGANITTAAGDEAELVEYASGDWRCTSYQRANGRAVVSIMTGTQQATTSGTAFDFTGIPSWASRLTILFDSVSLSGADNILVQIGDSGGIETTGYVSTSVSAVTSTSTAGADSNVGFIVRLASASNAFVGVMTLTRMSGNKWCGEHSGRVTTSAANSGGGVMTLSDVLTQVRITRTGSDSFDGGAVNVVWE